MSPTRRLAIDPAPPSVLLRTLAKPGLATMGLRGLVGGTQGALRPSSYRVLH